MRATQTTTFRSLQSFMDRTTDRLASLQLQAATGKRLNRPSDDPTAISPVLSARTQIMASDRYIETIKSGLDRIDNMDGYLDGIENTLVRIKEINLAAVNGSLSDQDRKTYADEVNQLREQLIDSGNAQVNGRYLFAGFAEETKPFTLNPGYPSTAPAAPVRPVMYNGDNGALDFEIAPNELIEVNISGNGFLLGDFDNDGTTDPGSVDIFALVTALEEVLLGQTARLPVPGATVSTATEGIVGVQAEAQDLDLADVTLANGSSLNFTVDGSEFTYTNSSGDFLSGADLAADIAANLAVTNYTLTDSGNGVVTFTQDAGFESDIAPITTTLNPTLENLINPLEEAADQLRTQRSLKGNVGRRLEIAREHMEQIKIDMEEFRSRFEDADILETITDLQQQQQSFQAALSVTGKVSELSILDYL